MQTKPTITPDNDPNREPAETQPAPPAERRIRVRPTRYGKTFLFILVAMLVGSLNSNNNLGFLLTFLLGSMAAVSVFHTRRNLAGIELAHMRARPVFAGEQAAFEIHLRKTGQTAYAVQAALPGENPVTVDLVNGSLAPIHIGIPATRRGLLSPGPLEIFTNYPFGLFRAQTALPHSAGCIVYPSPIAGSLAAVPGEPAAGAGAGLAGPGVDDFVGLTAYQPGDNLGQISWKAYSRGRGLLIKQFAGESSQMLTIDWHAFSEPSLERKLSRLCGMVLQAHQTGAHFGLRLPAISIAPARGESHLQTCLTNLALFGLPGGMVGTPIAENPDTAPAAAGQLSGGWEAS